MRLMVLFGSKSDQDIYHPLNQRLKEIEQEVDFKILSAHRNAEQLDVVLKDSMSDLFIGGAGLAAHLPGVIASKTIRPVIGLPVKSQYDGLDSFCSILQMPYGVPVLTCYPNGYEEIIDFVRRLDNIDRNEIAAINVIISKNSPKNLYVERELTRLEALRKRFPFEMNVTDSYNDYDCNQFNIVYIQNEEDLELINKSIKRKNLLNIYVPILSKDGFKSGADIIRVMEWAKSGGMWVGTNNSRNAFLAFMEILNHYGRTGETLRDIRDGK
jgi:phosphoribosylaminoimidazole carboxylase PurE protein